MTSPWTETETEEVAEATHGESPFAESYDPTSESYLAVSETATEGGPSEWGAPFAPAEAEYDGEAYAPDGGEAEWESPFASTAFGEDEIMRSARHFPACGGDVTFDRRPWPHGKSRMRPRNVGGRHSGLQVVPRAEVLEFQLSDFDVDRHELKDKHREVIGELVSRLQAGVRAGRYSGDPIRVFTYGETSTTASGLHNAALSRNRAFNTLHAIRCELEKVGITSAVYGFYGTGEQHARQYEPDNTENPGYRGVLVRTFAPLKDCGGCKPPTPTGEKTSAICVSVTRIAPRLATRLPPDLIPLNAIVPGLRLPIAIVTRAQADVQVAEPRRRQSGRYAFQGWGLEVALPPGRTRVDIQADLRASIEVLMRASASLGGKLRLGPLKLSLRVDVSVFAQLVAKLCARLRVHVDANFGRPNRPELGQCRLVEARGVSGPAFPFAALSGPGLLVVPGAGYGPGFIHFGGPGVPGLRLAANPIPVPADKSTVKTLLVLGGNLQLTQGAAREAEYELTEAEWPEAFAELQSELAPFV